MEDGDVLDDFPLTLMREDGTINQYRNGERLWCSHRRASRLLCRAYAAEPVTSPGKGGYYYDLDHCYHIAANFCSVRPYKTAINQVNLIQLDPSDDDAPRFGGAFLCHAAVRLIIAL